jgi:hypothetical protein
MDYIAKFKAELRKRKYITNDSQPNSLYIKIELANIGRPVTILAASSCKWSSLLEFPTPQLSHASQAYSKIGLI